MELDDMAVAVSEHRDRCRYLSDTSLLIRVVPAGRRVATAIIERNVGDVVRRAHQRLADAAVCVQGVRRYRRRSCCLAVWARRAARQPHGSRQRQLPDYKCAWPASHCRLQTLDATSTWQRCLRSGPHVIYSAERHECERVNPELLPTPEDVGVDHPYVDIKFSTSPKRLTSARAKPANAARQDIDRSACVG
jgi:hypothetical protein